MKFKGFSLNNPNYAERVKKLPLLIAIKNIQDINSAVINNNCQVYINKSSNFIV